MASTLVFVLRFLHILSGVAWVGGAFIWSMVIAPRLLARGPPPIRRPVLEALVAALPRYFAVTGGNTILWGVLLLGTMVGWSSFFSTLQTGAYGSALGFGFLLAVIMLVLGFAIVKPTSEKMLALMVAAPPGPPSAELQAQLGSMGKKMAFASMATVLLGTFAVGAMAWAVNSVR